MHLLPGLTIAAYGERARGALVTLQYAAILPCLQITHFVKTSSSVTAPEDA